ASELGLARPLYYAVRLARQLLETPIPEAFLTAMERFRPNMLSRRVMASLLEAALAAPGARPGGYVAGARAYLYLRGHYLRMPLRLLIPHLLRKSGMRIASIGGGRPIQDVALGGRVAN
ncbi:MAG TPA: hypothetical protein VKU84_10645, partial [Stellaceae bacterium]|nr:hypothetical protein [Stellaceae bacterium]